MFDQTEFGTPIDDVVHDEVMDAMAIAHQEEQTKDADVQSEAEDHERQQGDVRVSDMEREGSKGDDFVPFDDDGDDIENDEVDLIKDEPHDEDGSGVADGDALLLHRQDLHDLTAAGGWGDRTIESADEGGTIDGVKAVAGYVHDKDGRIISFSMIANNLATNKDESLWHIHEDIIKQLLDIKKR